MIEKIPEESSLGSSKTKVEQKTDSFTSLQGKLSDFLSQNRQRLESGSNSSELPLPWDQLLTGAQKPEQVKNIIAAEILKVEQIITIRTGTETQLKSLLKTISDYNKVANKNEEQNKELEKANKQLNKLPTMSALPKMSELEKDLAIWKTAAKSLKLFLNSQDAAKDTHSVIVSQELSEESSKAMQKSSSSVNDEERNLSSSVEGPKPLKEKKDFSNEVLQLISQEDVQKEINRLTTQKKGWDIIAVLKKLSPYCGTDKFIQDFCKYYEQGICEYRYKDLKESLDNIVSTSRKRNPIT